MSVFREHWAEAREAGRAESITVNFRARGEILDAIDLAFGRTWGEGFEPLCEAPESREPAAPVDPCVELLVTDRGRDAWKELTESGDYFGEALEGAPAWRAAEARLLAKRIDELTAAGGGRTETSWCSSAPQPPWACSSARSTSAASPCTWWAAAATGASSRWRTCATGSRRSRTRWTGLALYSVLASPLGGVSLDAVALIGIHARRAHWDPWRMVREPAEELVAALPAADRPKLTAFVERFEAERRIAGQVSLETLIDRAVTLTGYDRHLLALPGGTRRMANVRKLMRMAREFEADEGRDLRGFIDAVAERDVIQAREGEAPLEAEALDAVRMMTVHRAKGLEFPVVCLADLGKDGREDDGRLRISDDGSVGLRLANLGGGAVDSTKLAEIKAQAKRAAEEEERRIFYVAATRAQEHLVLSGATDLAKRPEPAELSEPMRWVWRGFCAGLPSEGAAGISVDAYEGRDVAVRWTVCTPATVDEVLPAGDRAPGAGGGRGRAVLRAAAARARPAAGAARARGEPAQLLGPRGVPALRLPLLPRAHAEPGEGRRAAGRRGGAGAVPGLDPLLRGTVVHGLLERFDFARATVASDAEVAAAIELHGVEALPGDVADVRAMLERVAGSELRERIAAASRVRTELPFAFTLAPPGAGGRSLLINGVVDVLADEGARTLVVDWKSNPLGELAPEEIVRADYSTQRLIYALAALRAGAEVAEVAHCFLERPDEPAVALYEAADAERLERELLGLVQGVVEGRFEPSPEPHFSLCADCPGRAALCVHEPELHSCALFRRHPVLIWPPCHCASSSPRKRSGSSRRASVARRAASCSERWCAPGWTRSRRTSFRCTTRRPSRSSTRTTCRCSRRGTRRSRSGSRSRTRSSCWARSPGSATTGARRSASPPASRRGRLRGRRERGAGAHHRAALALAGAAHGARRRGGRALLLGPARQRQLSGGLRQ